MTDFPTWEHQHQRYKQRNTSIIKNCVAWFKVGHKFEMTVAIDDSHTRTVPDSVTKI